MVKELTPLHNKTNILAYVLEDGRYLQPTRVTLLDNSTDIDIYPKYEDFKHIFNDYKNRQKLDENNILEIVIYNMTRDNDIQLYEKNVTPSSYSKMQLREKR